jgi:hypothetical protein
VFKLDLNPHPESLTPEITADLLSVIEGNNTLPLNIKDMQKWLCENSNIQVRNISEFKLRVNGAAWHFKFNVPGTGDGVWNCVRGVIQCKTEICSAWFWVGVNWKKWIRDEGSTQVQTHCTKHVPVLRNTRDLIDLFHETDWTDTAKMDLCYDGNTENWGWE